MGKSKNIKPKEAQKEEICSALLMKARQIN